MQLDLGDRVEVEHRGILNQQIKRGDRMMLIGKRIRKRTNTIEYIFDASNLPHVPQDRQYLHEEALDRHVKKV